MDAGLGPHLADVLLSPPTGFMLIDSLLSGQKGAFASAVSHLILPSIVLATIPAWP
jgi:dipeptide transport system permease protein